MLKIKTVFTCNFSIFIIAFLLLLPRQTGATKLQKILQIDCDGTVAISQHNEEFKYLEKYSLGNVNSGMLYGRMFFVIDVAIDDNGIIAVDLATGEKTSLLGKKFSLEKNYKACLVGYVDEKIIIFSAQRYVQDVPINKQRRHYYLYQVDRQSKSIRKLPIYDCGNANFSFYDNEVYYTNTDGIICQFHDGKVQPLGIKGNSPTISPDGKNLAYISFGFFRHEVHIYDFQTMNKKTVLKLGAAWPIIRWAANNRYLAVKKRSDISSNPLWVVDILNSNNNFQFDDNHACNWFFVDKGWN